MFTSKKKKGGRGAARPPGDSFARARCRSRRSRFRRRSGPVSSLSLFILNAFCSFLSEGVPAQQVRPARRDQVHQRQQGRVRQRDARQAPLRVAARVSEEVDDSGKAPADRGERGAARVDGRAEHEQQHDARERLERVLVGALDAVEGRGVGRGVEGRVLDA
jgi:hypothetical protein